MNTYTSLFFKDVEDFIDSLPEKDRSKVLAHIKILEINFNNVYTKPLRGPVKELLVKKYRLLFFLKGKNIYFVTGFIKKSNKTPVREIEKVENLYKTYQI